MTDQTTQLANRTSASDSLPTDVRSYGPELNTAADTPAARLKRALWGRLRWAILLAFVFGAVGSVAGFKAVKPKYQSVGALQVLPNLPRILYKSDDNESLPMFDAYIEAQASTIKSRRVIDQAMRTELWKKHGGVSNEEIADFLENLIVFHPRGSQVITVSFMDESPNTAADAVRAIIDSYEEIYVERDQQLDTDRVNVLETRRTDLNNELRGVRDRILNIANEFGTDDLGKLYETHLSQVNAFQSSLMRAELLLASLESQQESQTIITDPEQLTARQLAVIDTKMYELVIERDALQRALDAAQSRMGPEHPSLKDATARLNDLDQQIDSYLADLIAIRGQALVDQLTNQGSKAELVRIRTEVQKTKALLQEAEQKAVDIGQKRLQIERLEEEAQTIQKRLEETEFRLETLLVEARGGRNQGRISVISRGDVPVEPASDSRKKMAVAGGLGGAGLGFSIMVLIGLLDRRTRSSIDAKHLAGSTRFLGMLPEFPKDMADPHQAAITAMGVHHIRSLLQIDYQELPQNVFCVTSSAPEAGKTSLTLALGLSWSAAGAKTLMIDADLTGGGLSRQTNSILRRKMGRILIDRGLITDAQLQEALEFSRQFPDRRLGEILIDRGHVTQADIDAALSFQEHRTIGLLEVLGGDSLTDCIGPTGIPNLYVLPVGSASGGHAARLSPHAMRRIIDQACQNFDTILIDTGPLPASLEAANIAPATDGVIFVVSRGDEQTDVKQALDLIERMGANLAGIVFNRAEVRDMRLIESQSSIASAATRMEADQRPGSTPSRKFGPIGDAVANTGSSWLFDEHHTNGQTRSRSLFDDHNAPGAHRSKSDQPSSPNPQD